MSSTSRSSLAASSTKIRNVRDRLPEKLRTIVNKRMRQYHAESALQADGLLTELARELDRTHPGAAASLREGMTETLTILRLGVPPAPGPRPPIHESG